MSTANEKNPFSVKFHNEFVNLMENLMKIFKRDKSVYSTLKNVYLEYRNKYDRFTYIHDTVDCIQPHIEAVKRHDESVFCNEDQPEIRFLPNLDFKSLWAHPLFESHHKDVIWRYLKNLYVLGSHYSDRQDEHIRHIVDQIRFDRLLQKKSDEETALSEGEQSRLTRDIMGLFNELFGPDSFVHELLAMDEVQEVLSEVRQNPINTIKRYMQNGGQLVKSTVEQIGERVKAKLMNGELDKNKIDRDIEKVHRIIGKLKSELPSDPRFKKLFDQIKQSFNIDLTNEELFNNPEQVLQELGTKFEKMSGMSLDELGKQSPEEMQARLDKLGKSDNEFGKMMSQLNTTLDSGDGPGLQEQLMSVLRANQDQQQSQVPSDEPTIDCEHDLPTLNDAGLPGLSDLPELGEPRISAQARSAANVRFAAHPP